MLLTETLRVLAPRPGESYLDLTAGYGGHARAFLEQTTNFTHATLVDRDDNALGSLGDLGDKGVELRHADFVTAARQLIAEGKTYDVILVDLGVSSPQLDQSERGFSFQADGPLDMRMDRRQELTAERLVNRAPSAELIRIIREYGEVPQREATRIVQAITSHRPLTTTKQLADTILGVHRGKWQRTHPATRTFQALRIAVNDELRQVEELLPLLPRLLQAGGRVGIISFHSLEDRFVKRYFKEQHEAGFEAELRLITKKPLAGDTYDVHNPRSRSAKFRAAVKI